MSGPVRARSTMRFGVTLGVAAVVLFALSPFINGNFGVGDGITPMGELWESAPVAVVVSMSYLILVVLCLLFSATLVAASLVMSHAEALDRTSHSHESAHSSR